MCEEPPLFSQGKDYLKALKRGNYMHPIENMCRFSECLDSSQDFLVVVGQLLWQAIDYEGAIVHS